MMAKAVATETEMNFVSIKGPELFSKYVLAYMILTLFSRC